MDVNVYIASLVRYGLDKKLIEPCDAVYVTNQLLEAMKLDSFEPVEPETMSLEDIRFDIPEMEDDQQLSLRLDVTLSNGQVLTDSNGTWSYIGGELVSAVG